MPRGPATVYAAGAGARTKIQSTKRSPPESGDFFYAGIHAGHLRREYRQCGAVVAYAAADAGGGAPGPAAGGCPGRGAGRRLGRVIRVAAPLWARVGFGSGGGLLCGQRGRGGIGAAAPRLWGAEFAEHLPALRAGSDRGGPLALAGALSPGGSGRRGRAGVQCVLPLPWGRGRRRGTAALLRGGCPAGRGHRLWAAALPARKARRGHPAARHGLCRGSGQSGARPAGAGGGRLRGG